MKIAKKPLLITRRVVLPNGHWLQQATSLGYKPHTVRILSETKLPVGGIKWASTTDLDTSKVLHAKRLRRKVETGSMLLTIMNWIERRWGSKTTLKPTAEMAGDFKGLLKLLWDILKLLILAVIGYLLIVRGIELLYGDELPPVGRVVAIGIWLVFVVFSGLWLLGF